jgi:4-aminobutyrate aminotransferase-like enzyme
MRASQVLSLLRSYESRNVTFIEPDGSWPVVWERARGVWVWDTEGRRYLDLTAGFGVAAAGHANARVVQAGRRQMGRLLHAMGDVHPHALKAELARELSRLTFERWTAVGCEGRKGKCVSGKVIFCNSGFEAVEAALKTAMLATGKRGVVAFHGAYHGTGYGALNVTHREHFRAPFRSQLGEFGRWVLFPSQRNELIEAVEAIRQHCGREKIGAIIVEPVQGRGGICVPPPELLGQLRLVCDEYGALLVLDEVYTGFGRTGQWFACEHSGVVPDLVCLGKALGGGFPISACVGPADTMDAAWPPSTGEAIHTSTFLGHPVGCAMALAHIREIRQRKLVARSARLGEALLRALEALRVPGGTLTLRARGLGLMAGLELCTPEGAPATGVAQRVIKAMLERGYILLPEGAHSNVISFTPPLTITERQLADAVRVLGAVLADAARGA